MGFRPYAGESIRSEVSDGLSTLTALAALGTTAAGTMFARRVRKDDAGNSN